jgi:hydroxyethylthiazole kinase-like uncharacterized protein yjeF
MKQTNELSTIDLSVLRRDMRHDTSKGDFGNVGIVGGACGMIGAPIITARAALLAGAGKVVVGFIAESYPLVDYNHPELMLSSYQHILAKIEQFDVLVIGVGFGIDSLSLQILTQFIDVLLHSNCVLIFDADALNLVAKNDALRDKFSNLKHKIITPHPLEAARLLQLSKPQVQKERYECVFELYRRYNSISLLKGHLSLITAGDVIYENQTGSSALSNAGQGDLLCGLIGAFIAQGMDMLNALRFAVYIHGLSSDELVKKYTGYNGITASDTMYQVPATLNRILYTARN